MSFTSHGSVPRAMELSETAKKKKKKNDKKVQHHGQHQGGLISNKMSNISKASCIFLNQCHTKQLIFSVKKKKKISALKNINTVNFQKMEIMCLGYHLSSV